jgi:outer membrane protein W
MKRWILALALLVCAVPAAAGGFSLFATGMTTDDADDEVGLGAKLEFNAGRWVDLQARVANYENLVTDAAPNVYEIQAVPIDFGVNWDIGDPAKTANGYVGGGISYWVMDFSYDTTTPAGPPRGIDIDPESGWYAEVGVDVAVHRAYSFFAEAVWRYVKTEVEGDDLGLPLDQGVSLTGVAVNLGMTLNWDFGGSGGSY